MRNETQAYYDEFSKVYDTPRDRGYHRYLDEAEFALARPYAAHQKVLEVGCGTGRILERLAGVADQAVGVDLSPGMLEKARQRGLEVHQADATELPFDDEQFDLVCSFKVLPHVEHLDAALLEMIRVTRPGGWLLLEFYNPYSLRGIIKKIKPPTAITDRADDHQVYTRLDSLEAIRRRLPPSVSFQAVHGLRTLTPFATLMNLPLVGKGLQQAERLVTQTPLSRLGGFLVVSARKRVCPQALS